MRERERSTLLTDEGGTTRIASEVHAILRNNARQVLIDDRNCAMHAIRASDVGGESKLSEKQHAVDVRLAEIYRTHRILEQAQFTCDAELVTTISRTQVNFKLSYIDSLNDTYLARQLTFLAVA